MKLPREGQLVAGKVDILCQLLGEAISMYEMYTTNVSPGVAAVAFFRSNQTNSAKWDLHGSLDTITTTCDEPSHMRNKNASHLPLHTTLSICVQALLLDPHFLTFKYCSLSSILNVKISTSNQLQ